MKKEAVVSDAPWVARDIRVAVPAKGYVAVFNEYRGRSNKRPIEAWVYAYFVQPGRNYATRKDGMWMWDGLVVDGDGPSLASEFGDFKGYEPEGGWPNET